MIEVVGMEHCDNYHNKPRTHVRTHAGQGDMFSVLSPKSLQSSLQLGSSPLARSTESRHTRTSCPTTFSTRSGSIGRNRSRPAQAQHCARPTHCANRCTSGTYCGGMRRNTHSSALCPLCLFSIRSCSSSKADQALRVASQPGLVLLEPLEPLEQQVARVGR